MKTLNTLTRLPFFRPDGSMCLTPGFDTATGIYGAFAADTIPPVPLVPNPQQIIGAIKTAWQPWSGYRFASEHDRAAMLAAILTVIYRPTLTTCPAWFFDASMQGSGKTKAGVAVLSVAAGHRARISAYVDGISSEAETAKRIVSLVKAGASYWMIDNVVGMWKSPVLAGAITEGGIQERLLGGNENLVADMRMNIAATGNNATLDADLGRRFIRIRIDPGVACPQARNFAFDPVDMALSTRLAIAHAVMVLFRAWQNVGTPVLGRGEAGFAEWSRSVRSVVLWLQESGYIEQAGLAAIGDPAQSILEAAMDEDPETEALGMLLLALKDIFKHETFTTAEIAITCIDQNRWDTMALRDALVSLLPGRRELTANAISKLFRYRRDRPVNGLMLQKVGENRHGTGMWRVAAFKSA